jgi:hypothetical protein
MSANTVTPNEVKSGRFYPKSNVARPDIPAIYRPSVAKKRRICYFLAMTVRSCRVTIQDMDGVSHTVEVTAATLYEAVAQGLAAIRGNEWVTGIAQGLNVVKVSAANVRVEHEVKLMDFTKWLDRAGGSPREETDRHRIRSILGMPVSR